MNTLVENLNISFLKNKIKKMFNSAKKHIVKSNKLKNATKSSKAYFDLASGTMTIEVAEMDWTVKDKKVKVFIVNRPEDFTDVLLNIEANISDINKQVNKHDILKYNLLRIIIRENKPTEVELVLITSNKKFISVVSNFKQSKFKVKKTYIENTLVSSDWVM